MKVSARSFTICISRIFIGAAIQAQPSAVRLSVTTSDQAGVVVGLEEQPVLHLLPNAGDSVQAIRVDETMVSQRMILMGRLCSSHATTLPSRRLSQLSGMGKLSITCCL